MAIDYTGYAQAYGGSQGIGANIQRGMSDLAAAIPTNEEKAQGAFSRYWSERDMGMSPQFQLGQKGSLSYLGAVGDAKPFEVNSLTEEWNKYRTYLDNKGIRMRPDEYTQFAQAHQIKSEQWGQDIASKFERMRLSGLSQSKIRSVISENPELLRNLVKISAINPAAYASISDYLSPGKGILPGLWGKGAEIGGALIPKGFEAASRGIGAFAKAKAGEGLTDFRKGFAKGARPLGALKDFGRTGAEKRTMDAVRAFAKEGRHVGRGLQAGVSKKGTKAISISQKNLKEAKEAWKKKKKTARGFASQKKDFKVGKKTYKGGKPLKAAVEAAKKAHTKAITPGQTEKHGVKVIQRYIKRYGIGGLISTLAKKMGTRQALSLVGKMGLSAAGKMSAIGAGASLAIDALTIAQISKILYDVVAEESGGLRAPQKMLFGGDEPSRAYGTTF